MPEPQDRSAGWAREALAGTTTFATMAYIIVVNPNILAAAGIPFGAAMTATILSAAFGTLLMGVYAGRPYAIAPYMGQNAFIAYTVVGGLGYTWQTALGAILVSGLLFTALSLFRVRAWLADSIPTSLKAAFAAGIGLFLVFIGLTTVGVVTPGEGAVPVRPGDLHDPVVVLAATGFALTVWLLVRGVPGAVLVGILATAAAAMALGLAPVPERIVGPPPGLGPTLIAVDVAGALSWGFASVILTVFVLDLVDTIGTLVGLGYRAGLVDERGRMPGLDRALRCDALATVAGALLGTTTCGTFIESAAGIEAGGRTGRTAVVVAGWFLVALFLAPAVSAVPPAAYGPALVVVGMLVVEPIRRLPFGDPVEAVPGLLTIALMAFSYDLGVGLTAGFASHVLLKAATGRWREVPAGMWVLGGLSVAFYAAYPY